MGTLTIDKKKFVVIEQKEFDKLQLLAAQKAAPARKLTLAAGKKHAYKLIDKWAKGKCLFFRSNNTIFCKISNFHV
jgi:hypothetical protein